MFHLCEVVLCFARHLEFLVCSGQNGTRALGVSSRSMLAMCGRVRLSFDVSEIKLVFSIPAHRPTPNIAPSWNVAPTDPLPMVRYDAKAGERSLDVMRWGLVPFWAKDLKVGFSNINVLRALARPTGDPGRPKSGSQRTRPWREMDSNPRSLSQRVAFSGSHHPEFVDDHPSSFQIGEHSIRLQRIT